MHYLHNSLVLNNDPGDRGHLPDLCNVDGVRDLFALFAVTMFSNALDDRTYQLPTISANQPRHTLQNIQNVFDLNAIPVIERHHFCYTRGLVLNIVLWFFDHYLLSNHNNVDEEIDGYDSILIPFLVHVGRHIIYYKRAAVNRGCQSTSTEKQVEDQIRSVLFYRQEFKEEFERQLSADHKTGYYSHASVSTDNPAEAYDMSFKFSDFTITERQIPTTNRFELTNFLIEGQTLADKRYFTGLSRQFDLDESGTKFNFMLYFKVDRRQNFQFK